MNIAFDSHKRYTLCSVADDRGRVMEEVRLEHERGALTAYLGRFPQGQAVAVEAIGNWYWIVDEIEQAGMSPKLVHARKAKLMLGCVNKTDRLDARGLNRQQAGTLPGIGPVLSIVISLEVGDVTRFSSPAALASYAGTVPRVHASGGRIRYGRLRPDVNRYLKWAYAEAANAIVINQEAYPDRHVTRLYQRVRWKKGHQKAIGALSRHLAEATYWVLTRKEMYREPALKQSLPTRV